MSDGLLVVALEASADVHGAAALRELKRLRPGLRAFGAGGPKLRAEGCETLVRAEELSVMGFVEVLPALPRIFRALDALEAVARERHVRVALLIDSPDFNLRLARRLKALGVEVAYFIGPTVWAWRRYRVRQIARDVARMLVILPFEEEFYARHDVKALYVGNPVADERRALAGPEDLRPSLGLDRARPTLALLPGSRRQEIARLWGPMLAAARRLRIETPGLQLVTPVAPTIDRHALEEEAAGMGVVFIDGRASEVLAAADAAIVASGTATLEAALSLCPTVVVYRTSWISWLLGRLLVRVRFVSLINLLAGERLAPELLQRQCTPRRIAEEARELLVHPEAQREGMKRIRQRLLGEGKTASALVARSVSELFG